MRGNPAILLHHNFVTIKCNDTKLNLTICSLEHVKIASNVFAHIYMLERRGGAPPMVWPGFVIVVSGILIRLSTPIVNHIEKHWFWALPSWGAA